MDEIYYVVDMKVENKDTNFNLAFYPKIEMIIHDKFSH